MNLKNTEKLLKEKFQNNDFDAYAVLVHYGDEEKVFYSPNTCSCLSENSFSSNP